MLSVLDVTIIYDTTIRPPGPKMIAAINPVKGWFYRINTKPWRPAVLLEQAKHSGFLDHDSYLECGDPLELDDYTVAESLKRHGIIGSIHRSCCRAIRTSVFQARTLSARDRQEVCDLLAPLIP